MSQFSRILYVVEQKIDQQHALSKAVHLARRHQAQLTILDVIPDVMDLFNPSPDMLDLDQLANVMKAERMAEINAMLATIPHENVSCQIEIKTGKPYLRAIEFVLQKHYDLVIKAAENPTWLNRLFGSDDMNLLRKCPCPVLMVKQDDKPQFQSIVAAVDVEVNESDKSISPLNQLILSLAGDMALADKASLQVLHCWQPPDEMLLRAWGQMKLKASRAHTQEQKQRHQSALQQLSDWLREVIGKPRYDNQFARFHLVEGKPDTVIPQFSQQSQTDLLVMGSLARSGLNGVIIGNTAEAVFEQMDCSVLVVKPEGFKSPVTAENHVLE